MRKGLSKILVTGGAGFISSAFVKIALNKGHRICVVDKLTYAGDLARLKDVRPWITFYKADIGNKKRIGKILSAGRFDAVINFAAETHVDRSIKDSAPFIETNIRGTQVLIDAARKCGIKRFIHISTDEVYGDIEEGSFCEASPLAPNSPYAASKAAADLLIKSYIRTYSFPALIIRPSNNYGPWQYPEKLIPLAILKILRNQKIPVYGDGKNIREWLYVEDCAKGIYEIMRKGKIGEIYNLGSGQELQNIKVAKAISKILKGNKNMIEFVKERPGHDIRYSLSSTKTYKQTDWLPKTKFKEGLEDTVKWYIEHKDWMFSKCKSISSLYK
ncbi:dTDP-glucose 4,6-dehydratase [Candidatus Omnitrophota bacterium]